MKIKFGIFDYHNPVQTLSIGFIPAQPVLSTFLLIGTNDFTKFVKQVSAETNTENKCITNDFTAEAVNQDGGKMIKLYSPLLDIAEPYYIAVEEFKEILEIYSNEKKEFDRNPELYKVKLVKQGAKIINIKDFDNNEDGFRKATESAEKGVVVVKNLDEKRALKKAAGIATKTTWQFWKK